MRLEKIVARAVTLRLLPALPQPNKKKMATAGTLPWMPLPFARCLHIPGREKHDPVVPVADGPPAAATNALSRCRVGLFHWPLSSSLIATRNDSDCYRLSRSAARQPFHLFRPPNNQITGIFFVFLTIDDVHGRAGFLHFLILACCFPENSRPMFQISLGFRRIRRMIQSADSFFFCGG